MFSSHTTADADRENKELSKHTMDINIRWIEKKCLHEFRELFDQNCRKSSRSNHQIKKKWRQCVESVELITEKSNWNIESYRAVLAHISYKNLVPEVKFSTWLSPGRERFTRSLVSSCCCSLRIDEGNKRKSFIAHHRRAEFYFH